MLYNSNRTLNFRAFLESAGAYQSDSTYSDFSGRTHPNVTLDFPTTTKHGEVFKVTVKGANYAILIDGGVTVFIPRNVYHKKYNRLPKVRRKDDAGNWVRGDVVTATFYKFKDKDDQNFKLQSFDLNNLR
jgi:hypothetical protein